MKQPKCTVLDSESECDSESKEVRTTTGTGSAAVFVSALDRFIAPKASGLSRKCKERKGKKKKRKEKNGWKDLA